MVDSRSLKEKKEKNSWGASDSGFARTPTLGDEELLGLSGSTCSDSQFSHQTLAVSSCLCPGNNGDRQSRGRREDAE